MQNTHTLQHKSDQIKRWWLQWPLLSRHLSRRVEVDEDDGDENAEEDDDDDCDEDDKKDEEDDDDCDEDDEDDDVEDDEEDDDDCDDPSFVGTSRTESVIKLSLLSTPSPLPPLPITTVRRPLHSTLPCFLFTFCIIRGQRGCSPPSLLSHKLRHSEGKSRRINEFAPIMSLLLWETDSSTLGFLICQTLFLDLDSEILAEKEQ